MKWWVIGWLVLTIPAALVFGRMIYVGSKRWTSYQSRQDRMGDGD